ncbi:MAG: hypothetical protein ABR987_12485 [Terracidiphilus sp.]|jgi:hypothetical protein
MAHAKNPEAQLAGFLAKYTPEIADLAEDIRGEMRKLYPNALELVYDNYNALVIGYCPIDKPSEAIFSIVLYPQWVSLFFLQAKGLPDPDRILRGSGTVARHIVLPSAAALHLPQVRSLMKEAEARAKTPFDPKGAHRLIIRSVSPTQRPRRPSAEGEPGVARPAVRNKRKKAPAGARS